MRLGEMLDTLGLKFEGRPHQGIDDSRNIARIALRMLRDDAILNPNERMHSNKLNSCKRAAASDSLLTSRADVSDESDCAVQAVTGDGSDSDDDDVISEELVRRMARVSVKEEVKTVAHVEEEDVSDLLTYYALQKGTTSKR